MLQHVQRMDRNRLPRQALIYRPEGRRNIGRPKKRCRIKEQRKHLTLNKHDDDDDDDDLLLSNTTTLIKCPDYRMSLYYVSFRQHISAVKRPSSGLYRASYVKYNGFDTQWDPTVFTVVL